LRFFTFKKGIEKLEKTFLKKIFKKKLKKPKNFLFFWVSKRGKIEL